ncbi:Zn-ribbon domain-containing OB-fold protein [Halomarina halobia]|uniref:Zn-ribbon domain-containing OB-fold protein n=1 Tax=Halomarina halobia TaxID=3033386 RepID=A0ABD6AG90_9EURY|nr:OB-fold domain-containing protein [Halomarina sp. PSR21]
MSGPRYERTKRQDQRLVGFECRDCGWVSFPEEKRTCKRCGSAPADFEAVQLAERGEIKTFVVQQYLPDDIETPQPVAIVDLPQVDGSGESARAYGLLTETHLEEIDVGTEVEARFRELFADGSRPINSFKFGVPRATKGGGGGANTDAGGRDGGDGR